MDAGPTCPQQRHYDDGGDDDEQRRRPARQAALQRDEERDRRGAEQQRRHVGCGQRHDHVSDAFEEIAGDARDAEQLRQLGRRDIESGAGFEPGQDRIGDEIRGIGQADRAAGDADDTNRQSQCRGERNVARGVAAAKRRDARCDHDGQCRCRSDGELPAGAENRVGNAGHEIAIEAGDRRQLGEGGVSQRFRNDECGQRKSGHDVEADTVGAKRRYPGGGWYPSRPAIAIWHVRALRPCDALTMNSGGRFDNGRSSDRYEPNSPARAVRLGIGGSSGRLSQCCDN